MLNHVPTFSTCWIFSMCPLYDTLGPSISSIQFLGVILDSSLPFLQFFSYTKGFYIGNILFLVWKLLYALCNVLVFIIMSSSKIKQLFCQKLKIKYRSILTLWIFLQHKCFDCRFNINSLKEKDYWWLEPNRGPRV